MKPSYKARTLLTQAAVLSVLTKSNFVKLVNGNLFLNVPKITLVEQRLAGT